MSLCNCECHKKGMMIMHCFPCCNLTGVGYINTDESIDYDVIKSYEMEFTVVPPTKSALLSESYDLEKIYKDKNATDMLIWFIEQGESLEDPQDQQGFKDIVCYVNENGLLAEVVEWTVKHYLIISEFDTSLLYALDKWDL